MRGQEDASGIAGPMADIQSGIIARIGRIAAVTEHAFYKSKFAAMEAGAKKRTSTFSPLQTRHLRAYRP